MFKISPRITCILPAMPPRQSSPGFTSQAPTSDRAALKELWRKRLKDARLRLDFARSYFREIQGDFADASISAPLERYELDHALRAERAALAEYERILRILNDLVFHGTIPKEEDWPRYKAVGGGE